ncbi:hypothetical protein [uncultured Fibrobacter sp.]|uniref:hypothetical protein n=1 Tax=uncultured Fibrobacter sp. TaxID=261512 RepID=UPI002639192F|nr:hypothetical protein [uncultured Fibrobacter sp.]
MSESTSGLIGGIVGSIVRETVNQINQNYKQNQKKDSQMMDEEELKTMDAETILLSALQTLKENEQTAPDTKEFYEQRHSILVKVLEFLVQYKPFILFNISENVRVVYCKDLDVFVLDPTGRISKQELITPYNDPDFSWTLPRNSHIEKLDFSSLSSFLKNLNLGNNSVLEGDRYFATRSNDCYNVYGVNSINRNRSSYTSESYKWPTFELKERIYSVQSLLHTICSHNLQISYLYDKGIQKLFVNVLDCFISVNHKEEKISRKDLLELLKIVNEQLQRIKSIKDNISDFSSQTIISKLHSENILDDLLNCDKNRADLEPYDEKLVKDPNRGHWELWGAEDQYDGLYARNPCQDVHESGVVGIDFGTKSTVVVFQSDSERIVPMRIGTGELRKEVSKQHYENPTTMELISINQFMNAYAIGNRPQTEWNDLKISHQAYEDFFASTTNGEYTAFFSDLKQWAGNSSSNKKYVLIDKSKTKIELPPFKELDSQNDFDPIEVYAYYLGLYINNMRNGIFLDYYLSFPVTYEVAVQKHITESFRRGLLKSLPTAVVEKKELMERFRVNGQINEPAAYAACAMREYNFIPEDGKKVYFGVFDFGGGTTDFDFGEWQTSTKPRYDFIITHYGAQGDRYLGGENLLALLAFEIFKKNAKILSKEGITFMQPAECNDFQGSEMLIDNNSCEAAYNIKNLMKALRPIWEGTETEGEKNSLDNQESLEVNLLNAKGELITGFRLDANRNEIMAILKSRIDMGVQQFFAAFHSAFYKRNDKEMRMESFNILLAGNSSKSPIVKELFNQYLEQHKEDLPIECRILPPIGSEDFYKTLQESNPDYADSRDEMERPTGKTGVAFGLLLSRKGGRIKVENLNLDNDNGEKFFAFYVGFNSRNKFQIINDKNVDQNAGRLEIGVWYRFMDVEEDDDAMEIYYTDTPSAITNKLNIVKTKRIRCSFNAVDKEAGFFIRAKDPHTLEWAIAKSENECNNGKEIILSR